MARSKVCSDKAKGRVVVLQSDAYGALVPRYSSQAGLEPLSVNETQSAADTYLSRCTLYTANSRCYVCLHNNHQSRANELESVSEISE